MIDAWMQHSIDRYFGDPMFDSLRRWTKSDLDAVPTIADTVAALDAAGVFDGADVRLVRPQQRHDFQR